MTTKKTTASSATPVDAAVAAGKETMEKMTKLTHETGQKNFEQAVTVAKENMEKASAAAFKGYDEFATYSQANYDAFNKSFGIMTKGFEDVSKAWFSYTQSSVDAGVDFSKKVMGAKSVNEIVDLQNDFAKSSFDSFVAESTKLSEMSVKTANEAIEPIKARVDETVVSISKVAA
ncbi:phasin family protein [Thalassobaculum sp. OXR-137]|uniref:phasin family protein n=1 Tax=Thalassobaculum sp. OXR-137 TaxID=3100173 RepID=UPI002AC8ACE1|nr:phasin family protein [Thalassobaculum sp. OXR-137]WPZ36658.1 phasin family protein [Thalassobaculum sp. OXR-137]